MIDARVDSRRWRVVELNPVYSAPPAAVVISVQSAVISNGRLSLSNDDFSQYRGKTSGLMGRHVPGSMKRKQEVSRCCYIVARDDICRC
jgi:hypothetical protein